MNCESPEERRFWKCFKWYLERAWAKCKIFLTDSYLSISSSFVALCWRKISTWCWQGLAQAKLFNRSTWLFQKAFASFANSRTMYSFSLSSPLSSHLHYILNIHILIYSYVLLGNYFCKINKFQTVFAPCKNFPQNTSSCELCRIQA